jgi:hypothetical protein
MSPLERILVISLKSILLMSAFRDISARCLICCVDGSRIAVIFSSLRRARKLISGCPFVVLDASGIS